MILYLHKCVSHIDINYSAILYLFIIVTNKTASTKRTEIEKLTASDLPMLVDNPDITTDNSCESKDVTLNQLFDSKYMNENYRDFCDTEIYLNIVSYSNLFLIDCVKLFALL